MPTASKYAPTAPCTGNPGTWRTRYLLAVVGAGLWLAGWLASSSCLAQEISAPAVPDASDEEMVDTEAAAARDGEPSNRIRFVGPDTYILQDAQGRPQAMPGMTYEDFMAAWKQLQEAPQERLPRYTIELADLRGRADQDTADLRFELTVRSLVDGALEVPLGLTGAILQGEPELGRQSTEAASSADAGDSAAATASSEEYLDFEPSRGGFVAHLTGKAGERHTVALKLLVPLVHEGAETTLMLNCPRALAARLALDVGKDVTEANVNGNAILSRETTTGGTRLLASGVAGQFRLSWSTAEVAAAELSTVLSAISAIQISIDGRSVRTDARLTVESYGGGFDRFRVRLPQGARLIQDPARRVEDPGYRLTIEGSRRDADGARSATAGGQVVLVQLPEKRRGPTTIELATEQSLELKDSEPAIELGGFEVVGAVRQFGDVALRVANDWQLRWDARQYVRQVDPSELDVTLQQPGLTAAFQFDRQPWSLGVQVVARRFRLQVTPEYELECLPDELRLRVRLAYQILGARAFKFRVDLHDWELAADPVESGGLVDREGLLPTRDGVLELPLLQASTRRADVSFVVRRLVPRDASRISVALPVPVAESIGTGELVVRTAPGIELMPDMARSTGLTATPAVSGTEGAGNNNDFHFRFTLPGAVFAADRMRRAREITQQITADIAIEDNNVQVKQRVGYSVRFEPISELVFEIPPGMRWEDEDVEIVLVNRGVPSGNGIEQVEATLQFALQDTTTTIPPTREEPRVRVTLPQPRLGEFEIELRYSVGDSRDATADDGLQIPLAVPVDGRSAGVRAVVAAPRNIRVALSQSTDSQAWKAVAPAAGDENPNSLVLEADDAQDELPLVLRPMNMDAPMPAIVDRAWLQTWISGNVRQDRATFRFRTAGQMVTVELPPEASADEVEVLVDGQPANVVSRLRGRLSIRVPSATEGSATSVELHEARPHTMELRYRRATSEGLLTRRFLIPPQLVGTRSLAEVYWQIVLPGGMHVVRSPQQLASASDWQWLGNFWGRRPNRSQAELEQWVGASSQIAPSAVQNEYLFSGLTPVSSIEVVTAPRWLIVLGASGAVLALALAWIYVPAVRRPWLAMAAACALVLLAVAFPTPAMLLAQASGLGVVLAVAALLIARFVEQPRQWSLPISSGSTQRHLAPRAESVVQAVLAPATASASTAPAAPARLPDNEA